MPIHHIVLSNIKRDKELSKFMQLNRPPNYLSQTIVVVMKD